MTTEHTQPDPQNPKPAQDAENPEESSQEAAADDDPQELDEYVKVMMGLRGGARPILGW